MEHYEVAVVGLGILGSAAAHHASVKGAKVLGLEQFEFGHVRGASHDTSRIFRTSYGSPAYVALARAAYKDWAKLEEESGQKMLSITGGVVFFPRSESYLSNKEAGAFAKTMTAESFVKSIEANDVPYELLDSTEANRRWPQFNVPSDVDTVYTADSGIVHAARSTAAFQYLARARGAVLKENTRVDRVIPGKDGVVLETSKGRFSAGKVILTADAWINKLLDPLNATIPLSIMQEQVTYFKPSDTDAYDASKFPVWIWAGQKGFYGFPTYGEPTIKAGQDMALNYMTPEERTFVPSPKLLGDLTEHMNALIPGKGERSRTVTCQYAITPDRQFVVSPLEEHKNIIVGLGGGHIFKFAPAVGRILAELAIDGKTNEDISEFGIPKTKVHVPSKL
jgi:sarcosine oxidase